MKAIIPYAILGLIGTAGALSGRIPEPAADEPSPLPAVPKGPAPTSFRVEAGLERTSVTSAGGEVFARIALEGIPNTHTKRTPVSLTLVIDRSGSMSGKKMEDAKRAALEALDALAIGDQVSVVSFDDGAVDHGSATISGEPAALAGLRSAIGELFARHGTDMIAGLDVGDAAARRVFGAERVNRLLLLSDGRPNQEPGLRERVAALASRGVQTTTIGLGQDYNEDLMAALADQGRGHYYFVDRPEQLSGIFVAELSSLASIVAKEATVELVPAPGARIVEVIGFESHADGRNGGVTVSAGDIYGGRVTDILVRLAVEAGSGRRELISVRTSASPIGGAAREVIAHQLGATQTADLADVERSLVPTVAVKVEKWRAAQAWVEANRAFDNHDVEAGNRLLTVAQARLEAQAAALGSDELVEEKKEMASYQKDNNEGGEAWRGVGTRAAKKKAWSLNKGSAY